MILILVFTLLSTLCVSEIVRPALHKCACDKIKLQEDCQAISSCKWTITGSAIGINSDGYCVTALPTTSSVTYCSQITQPAVNCWKTLGCAYVEQKCIHFTGCTAYVKTTNSDCQAISSHCTTDGTQCINAKPCNEYKLEEECNTYGSSSGNFQCKWDKNVCRDYVCQEADSTLNTDAACNAWLAGCVTTGKGCNASLQKCESYIGDNVICSGLKGIDGNCEGTPGGTNCTTMVCNKADFTLKTDEDCAKYQIGCITNGKGCIASPLPACSIYRGDNITCVGYIGSDGICEGDRNAMNCRSRICTNAPLSSNTDLICSAYMKGCVTTGKGCDTTKRTCGSYSGTITSCLGYIGTDGYCEGSSETLSPCIAKVCDKAPIIISTDEACEKYQKGCKTTGKGCTTSLGLCSGYFGTITTCEGYIGEDGNCKGTSADTEGPCTRKICTEAPSSINTNLACYSYQKGCVTNGYGCISQIECLDTIKQISCIGTPGCGWNNICVSSQQCSDFLTASICDAVNLSERTTKNTPCYWTGTQCRNLTCTDAPITHNTDSLCNDFLTGCLTNGQGCLAYSAPCSQYFGNRQTCSAFTKKCWNLENTSSTATCTERNCSDDTTSTKDSACDSFKTGCKTKGVGCIDPQIPCSGYWGIQSDCNTFKGNNGQTRCWALSATTPSSCIDKTCSHIVIAQSDIECENFFSGCFYSGAGCTSKSSSCHSYIGTQSNCSNFKGTNQTKICWSTNTQVTGFCIEKECHHAPQTNITIADCEQFLTGCVTNGSGCVPADSPCTSFTGTLTECEKFVGNKLPCYNKDPCTDNDKVCSDKLNPNNNDDCLSYLSTCRYFNGACVNAGHCSIYSGTSLAMCQDILDIANQKCWWTSGSTCIQRSCSTAPNTTTSQVGCDAHIQNCVYAGSGTCVTKGACNGYPANGAIQADKLANCQAMVDINGKHCFYTNGESCESKTCNNVPGTITGQLSCDSHISGCRFNGSLCVTANTCANYMVTGTDSEKISKCQSMTDTSSKACWWITGNNCSDRSCATATSIIPTSQAICDVNSDGSCAYQFSCLRVVCQLKTNAMTNLDCLTHDSNCRYIGNPICINAQLICSNYVIDQSVTSLATKQSICSSLTDSNSGTCSFSGTGQNCRVRACFDKVDATANQTECSAWKSTCRFTGKTTAGGGCQDMNSNCAYILDASFTGLQIIQICEQITGNAGEFCMAASSGSACVARTCAGKTTATADQAACAAWKPTCRFTGKTTAGGGCQDMQSNCAYTLDTNFTVLQIMQICEQLTDNTGNQCMAAPSGSTCVVKTCSGKSTPTADQAACAAWMPNCRFTGKTTAGGGCQDASNDCVYTLNLTTSTAAVVCLTLTDIYGNACMGGVEPNCVARTCQGKTTATADKAECSAWMPTCLFTPIAGIEMKVDCLYRLDPSITALADVTNMCEQLADSSGNKCTAAPSGPHCIARTCAGKTTATADQAACAAWMPTCRWTGKKTAGEGCQDIQSDCAYTVHASITAQADIANTCEQLTDSGGNQCMAFTSGSKCLVRTCAGKTTATADQAACAAWMPTCRWTGKTDQGGGCQDGNTSCIYQIFSGAAPNIVCPTLTDLDGYFCMAGTGANLCTARTCAGKTNASSHADCNSWKTGCQWTGKTIGITCAVKDTCFNCEARNCQNIKIIPATNKDCTDWLSTCRFTGSYCVAQGSCSSYNVTGSDIANRIICEGIQNASGQLCAYANTATTCSERQCSLLSTVTQLNCIAWLGTTCRWDGTQCLNGGACNSYQTIGQTDQFKKAYCKILTDISDPPQPCDWTQGLQCTNRDCFNVSPVPITNQDCQIHLSSCRLTNKSPASCIPQTYTCSQYEGTAQQCKGYKGVNDTIPCWSIATDTDAITFCIDKQCNHNTTATTNAECNLFLPNCKTNGLGCISSSPPCSSFEGNASTCSQRLSSDGITFCKVTTSVPDACTVKTCQDDGVSTTDAQCQAFMKNCVTIGIGCVPNTEPCSIYSGTQEICSRFKGNKIIPCWNLSTATPTTPCIEKACSHNTSATSDIDCEIFLPSNTNTPKCVTNGNRCVDYPRTCSDFTGTLEECGRFTASDGPCKTTETGACTPRICAEASISTYTDALCQAYHPSCVTNGYGCATSVSCSTIEKKNTCDAIKGCSWVGNCRSIGTECSSLTQFGSSICVNTPVSSGSKKCFWYDQGCKGIEDLPVTISTHNECQAISNLYTTTGTGCTLMGPCTSYTTEQVCKSAMTTDIGQTCVWDITTISCRAKQCTDAPNWILTDSGCETYLTGCRTNGISCIVGLQNCQIFKTADSCLLDDQYKPCLWVNDFCYNFSKCEDIHMSTHEKCQAFSPQCVTNGEKCIPITTCAQTVLQPSCRVGTDGKCGWLPTQKCEKFRACIDVAGIDNTSCGHYGNCITDGTNCVDKGPCSNYLNHIACASSGTDGVCIYDFNKCRLRKCEDAATDIDGLTHSNCYSYIAQTKCTTNGTNCVPLSTCSSYIIQDACVQGTDGFCVFSLPVGVTYGTPSCRLKACSDFNHTSSAECNQSSIEAELKTGCIYDGKTCIPKSECSTYTAKEACNEGGTDGLCAYIPSNKFNMGSCKKMTTCMDADNDPLACNANSEACNWQIFTVGDTSMSVCNPHTCHSKGLISKCGPIPSFDFNSYTICGEIVILGCKDVLGSSLSASTCSALTMNTYTWDVDNKMCTACFSDTGEEVERIDGILLKSLATIVILMIVTA